MFKRQLGSHCKANIVVRSDSIAIQFLVGLLRHHVGFNRFAFTSPVETMSAPIFLLVELWGTAPQSKTTIPQRIQNHHRISDTIII